MDTSFLNEINWIAVLVAGLAFFVLGALWYSKLLFAPKWLKYTKIDPNNPDCKKGMGGIMLTSLVMMILTSVGLAILVNRLELPICWLSGVKLGTVTGLLFGTTAISISYVYEKRPVGLYLINGGYTLVGNIIAAVIICCWQ